jgi:2-polyprenyl-6-hydroxyphenyl methylase / 3-demethylubiquinone-9 3-methyltransferase
MADSWWDEAGFLHVLRGLNPARFGYMRRVLVEEMELDPRGRKALDVGCGGGLLAEEFARLGCDVTGIDPSEKSLEAARNHARELDLAIAYTQGAGEQIPFPDAAFDLAYCCDVLEHVADLPQVIREISRILKPDGIFLYDTLNRTFRSKLVMIKLLQEWRWTSLMPPDLHDWKKFIRPQELISLMAGHGLENRGLTGLEPAANPLRAVRILRARKRGEISHLEAIQQLGLRESRDTGVLYAGYAQKAVPTASRI